jgi:hypothetical protein
MWKLILLLNRQNLTRGCAVDGGSTMTTNTTFATLISVYPTAEGLMAYLKSPEGGRLVVRDFRSPGPSDPYVLVHYDKEVSDMTHINTKLFRSIVWNMVTNRPACISPPRGAPFSASPTTGWVAEEFVDGVMINAFYDDSWKLASRTQLGAGSSFYGTRPFAELFAETCKVQGVDLATLDKTCCYSFVLNHPTERVVVPALYGTPTLTLVATYRIDPATGAFETIAAPVVPNIKVPTVYKTLETLEGVVTYVAARAAADRQAFQGVVLKGADCRWKLRSSLYSHVRFLRGNQAKLPFLWLDLWSRAPRSFQEYLTFYPEESVAAQATVEAFKGCTQAFHDLFIQVYKKHELPLGSAPQKYRKLLWEARHAAVPPYFPALRDFMNQQDTARKLWLVNYEVRYAASKDPVVTEVDSVVPVA